MPAAKNLILLLILSLATLQGCGKSQKEQTQFQLLIGGLTGDTFPGGIFLKTEKADTGEADYVDVPATHMVEIEHNTYNFYFVSYQGPSAWAGLKYCGSVLNQEIIGSSQTISLSVAQADCSVEPYLSMDQMKNPSALWDVAVWGSSTWQ